MCTFFTSNYFRKKKKKIQINIWRNTFYKERVHVYMYGFLTSSIFIDEVNNYTGVILRIVCFDLNCPLFTCLDFWHRLSSIMIKRKIKKQKQRRMKLEKQRKGRRKKTCNNSIKWLSNSFVGQLLNILWRIYSYARLTNFSRLMTKPTKRHVRPAKTQISLGIRPVWSESSLSAWRKLGSLATHWAHSEDSDQIGLGGCPGWSESSLGAH